MPEKFHYKSVLGRKLILYVMLFSISIIVIGSSFVLYLDYSEDRDHLDDVVSQIKTSQLPSVIKSLWVADRESVEIKLNEILSLPYISYLEIKNDRDVLARAGNRYSDNVVTRTYPLFYSFRDRRIKLGELYLEASVVGIYQRLIRKILTNLLILGVFVFLTAILGYRLDEVIGETTKLLYADPKDYEKQGQERCNRE